MKEQIEHKHKKRKKDRYGVCVNYLCTSKNRSSIEIRKGKKRAIKAGTSNINYSI